MASRFVFMGNLPTLVATHLACSEHSPHQRRFDETAAREIDPSELADARRITYSLGDLVRSNFSRSSLPGQFCLHVGDMDARRCTFGVHLEADTLQASARRMEAAAAFN
jgi:hypothetical protein